MLLDTHALLWYTLAPDQLSERGRRAIRRAGTEQLHVSASSFWEIALKVSRSQIELGMDLDAYVRAVEQTGLNVVSVDATQWIQSVSLPWEHRDPVDRVLVALARTRRWKLLSRDAAIQGFYPEAFW